MKPSRQRPSSIRPAAGCEIDREDGHRPNNTSVAARGLRKRAVNRHGFDAIGTAGRNGTGRQSRCMGYPHPYFAYKIFAFFSLRIGVRRKIVKTKELFAKSSRIRSYWHDLRETPKYYCAAGGRNNLQPPAVGPKVRLSLAWGLWSSVSQRREMVEPPTRPLIAKNAMNGAQLLMAIVIPQG
jgi:hypothetical protein